MVHLSDEHYRQDWVWEDDYDAMLRDQERVR